MNHSRWILLLFVAGLATGIAVVPRLLAHKANPSSAEQNGAAIRCGLLWQQHEPTGAELSRDETPGLRGGRRADFHSRFQRNPLDLHLFDSLMSRHSDSNSQAKRRIFIEELR
jgi:hypothetical protein